MKFIYATKLLQFTTWSWLKNDFCKRSNQLDAIYITQKEDIEFTDTDSRETIREKYKNYDIYLKSIKETLKFERLEEYRNHWALKTGDIFNLLNNNQHLHQFNNPTYISLFPHYQDQLPLPQYIDLQATTSVGVEVQATLEIDKPQEPQETQEPQEQYISNLSEYMQIINQISDTSSIDSREVFFRGHSNADRYFLQPSLFRQYKDKGLIYLNSERNSYMDLLTTDPSHLVMKVDVLISSLICNIIHSLLDY
ncbi:hypothetical protein ACNPMW_04850 [Acinetobacter junii]|uniref:hypothetical protein n=1 Tax=Acinetobacter junii TaxID=40215 RepID=UPI003AA7BC63